MLEAEFGNDPYTGRVFILSEHMDHAFSTYTNFPKN